MGGMGTATTGLLTFEDFERLPEHDEPGKRELLDGELIEMPPADLVHSGLSKIIFLLLLDAVRTAHSQGEAAELGEVYVEAGYQLGRRNYVQPDVSVTHANQARGTYLENSPAIAIEVISPGNSARAMEKEVELYFSHGAREVWRVYRDPLHIVVHTGDSSRTVRDGAVTTPLLPGFELPLARLLTTEQGL